ncbi:MAG: tautomerase family protein [Dehalococcoidales bacterium]|jgi:4-oxalocrotonate tautomerase family enzyme|nr:tautomerase family protein [Dehalococcoidales bacterium]MDD5604601.1 tautomerase family protein [Dehalococcoidales bacterium]MDX9986460.1 tautomerase family protein [Dehalococcoidales bacterium]
MPVIKIEWAAGRNDEAKKKIDESITDIITENTGVNSESVIVIFEDIPQNSLYIGRKSLG